MRKDDYLMRQLVIRVAASAAVGLAFVALAAGPATAHEEITPHTAVVGKPTFLQLTAANEKKVALNKVTLHAPAQLPFGTTTRSPAGWHAAVSETAISWSGGTVAPDAFETWGFEIEGADQAATFTYKVDLGFADGTSDSVDVPITAVADGATTATTSGGSTTITSGGGSSTSAATATTAAAASRKTKGSDGTARTLGIVALVVSLLALLLAATRRSRPAGGSGVSPTEPGNDW
jgi:hypothetical protein